MKKSYYIFIIFLLFLGCSGSKNSSDKIQSLVSLSKLNFITNNYLATNELTISSNLTKNIVVLNLKNCETVSFFGNLELPEILSEKKDFVLETNIFNYCYGNSLKISIEKIDEKISDQKQIYSVSIFGEIYKMYLY